MFCETEVLMKIDDYFEQQGAGEPIVFIHGSYATTATWKNIVNQLAAQNHCISMKLPGHCGTGDPDDFSNPTMETELGILESVVNRLTDQPVHLVGHSYGGLVALQQALKGSLELSQITLFEPVAVWVLDVMKDKTMSDRVHAFLAKYRHDVDLDLPHVCGQVIDFWAGEGTFESFPESMKNGMAPLVRNNVRHWDACAGVRSTETDLKNCLVPARIVCGTESNPVAHAIADHLCDQLPNGHKYLIEGASHFLVTSHYQECISVLQDPFTANDPGERPD